MEELAEELGLDEDEEFELPNRAEVFEAELKQFAEQEEFDLTAMPAGSNDSSTLAFGTEIPTVAIEVPIRDMHKDIETCSKEDIELARRFLKTYLVK